MEMEMERSYSSRWLNKEAEAMVSMSVKDR